MKILWLDINASYGHASLALPALHAQAREITDCEGNRIKTDWSVLSATTQAEPGLMASQAVAMAPDLVASTLWLFNHELVTKILSRIKALRGDIPIVLGGPEFLGSNESFLRSHPYVDLVFRGEGEEAFWDWLPLSKNRQLWGRVEGFCFLAPNGTYHDGGKARVEQFEALNPPEQSPFFDVSKPFVQLESSRGCSNHCAFCVSGSDAPVRNIAMAVIEKRLEALRSRGVREIRLLDRTFNGNAQRACALLTLFASRFPDMRFHLEVHPARLTPEIRQLLLAAPAGSLHIEAGVQSLRPEVLKGCGRSGTVEATLHGLRFLAGNTHFDTHADLIAGLPGYSLNALLGDIAQLASLGVAEIQLELLKVLPGTRMRAEAATRQLCYAPDPPYEVLSSHAMSPEALQTAVRWSRILDLFYNTAAFHHVTIALFNYLPAFLTDFLAFLEPLGVVDKPISLEHRGRLFFAFCERSAPSLCDAVTVAWLKAGLSVQKEPCGRVEPWKGELPAGAPADKEVKWYRLTMAHSALFLGYDRSRRMNVPLYLLEV